MPAPPRFASYNDVAYHNSTHAADVVHMMHLLCRPRPNEDPDAAFFQPKALFAACIAAAAHDVGHPGTNNAFNVNAKTSFALTHNDDSCLERYHSATLFETALQDPEANIFSGFSTEDYKSVRSSMIEMILSTDNAVHMQLVEKFKAAPWGSRGPRSSRGRSGTTDSAYAGNSSASDCDEPGEGGGSGRAARASTLGSGGGSEAAPNTQLALNTLLHAADIGSSSKQWDLYMKWTDRLFIEFWKQGDEEKRVRCAAAAVLLCCCCCRC